MQWVTILGLAAAVLTTSSFIPQVIKVIRTRQVKDISVTMYAIITVGISLWLAYGIVVNDLPVILANAVTLALVSMVLVLRVIWR